jgi:hypothetical protein
MHSGGTPTVHPPYVSGQSPGINVTPGYQQYECAHGWTEAMSVSTPSITGDDLEPIAELRKKYDFCNESHIVAIRCTGLITEKKGEEMGETVKCDQKTGFSCYGRDQTDKKCEDYAVQFYCDCRISKYFSLNIVSLVLNSNTCITKILLFCEKLLLGLFNDVSNYYHIF